MNLKPVDKWQTFLLVLAGINVVVVVLTLREHREHTREPIPIPIPVPVAAPAVRAVDAAVVTDVHVAPHVRPKLKPRPALPYAGPALDVDDEELDETP